MRRPAVIICESPPLFLGISAMVLKKIKGARLVFNVSDLWPESAEKLNIVTNKQMLGISYWLEKKIYQTAALVSGQTQGIIKNIQARYPIVPVYWFKNGIDTSTFNLDADGSLFRLQNNVGENDFVLLYAGIIGHAGGLEVIIKAANILKRKKRNYFYRRRRSQKDKLVKLSSEYDLRNIRFMSNMPGNKIPEIVAACDAYIVPLKKNDLFKGAIPSKLFEPLAMGKPILLGVDGEAKKIFIEDGNCGIAFEPENEIQLAKGIQLVLDDKTLLSELGANGKAFVFTKF